jgi:hypothetical protein
VSGAKGSGAKVRQNEQAHFLARENRILVGGRLGLSQQSLNYAEQFIGKQCTATRRTGFAAGPRGRVVAPAVGESSLKSTATVHQLKASRRNSRDPMRSFAPAGRSVRIHRNKAAGGRNGPVRAELAGISDINPT